MNSYFYLKVYIKNSNLTRYISRKMRGRVTFFNSHNLHSGLFRKNFLSCPVLSWLGLAEKRSGRCMWCSGFATAGTASASGSGFRWLFP